RLAPTCEKASTSNVPVSIYQLRCRDYDTVHRSCSVLSRSLLQQNHQSYCWTFRHPEIGGLSGVQGCSMMQIVSPCHIFGSVGYAFGLLSSVQSLALLRLPRPPQRVLSLALYLTLRAP